MNTNPSTDETTCSNESSLVVGGGLLFGLGVTAWITAVPMVLVIVIVHGSTSALANGMLTIWIGIYAVVSGVGTFLVFTALGSASRASRGLLGAYVTLLVIGIVVQIWSAIVEGAPYSCEVPPCTY